MSRIIVAQLINATTGRQSLCGPRIFIAALQVACGYSFSILARIVSARATTDRPAPGGVCFRTRMVLGSRRGGGCVVATRQSDALPDGSWGHSRCLGLSGVSSFFWQVLVGCCQAVHDGSGSEAGFWRRCRGDHLGTTQCARPRTTQAFPHVLHMRKAPQFRGIRRSHLTGGQVRYNGGGMFPVRYRMFRRVAWSEPSLLRFAHAYGQAGRVSGPTNKPTSATGFRRKMPN